MAKKSKYRYNIHTLSYEKVSLSVKDKVLKWLSQISLGLVFAALFIFIAYNTFDSPKEKILKRENKSLVLQYELLDKKLNLLYSSLENLEEKDDNIYRTIFEAEPISKEERNAGFGGVNRYKHLENFTEAALVKKVSQKIDILTKKLYVQSKSFEEIFDLAKQKEKMLSCIPAIQPISNKELKHMASGYGHRIHPIYKTKKMHWGMDFSSPTGSEVYATGNGKIEKIERSSRGYGNHVIINHGFGYKTLYAHLSAINVREGQKIQRGEAIGKVGNTGTSTAPHLHYEVIKGGEKINPINFYFNDLSADEFDKMLEISSSSNQSFD